MPIDNFDATDARSQNGKREDLAATGSAQDGYSLKIIGRIRTDLPTKFGVPRQSGLVAALQGSIVFEPDYRNADALRGLQDFSHIWLIWGFSQSMRETASPTVRPPRCGGNRRLGVFATRSPFRPNAIGLSCVELESIELATDQGPIIHVSGVDMVDGTPVFDIKPYLPYTDCRPEATGGYTDHLDDRTLQVIFPGELLRVIPREHHAALIGVLSHDPRPSYQKDTERIYGLEFGRFDIRFTLRENVLTVCEVVPL